MPAGTDLVSWFPRTGATGDDRYTWDINEIIYPGPSGYSDPPLLSEINDTTNFGGFNGIIAEINRRNRFYYNTRGKGSFTATAYVSSVDEVNGTLFKNLRTAIDTIRSRERLSTYSWNAIFSGAIASAPIAAGSSVELIPEVFSDLRKALATDKLVAQGYIPDGDNNLRAHRNMRYRFATYPPDTGGVFAVTDEDTTGQDGTGAVHYFDGVPMAHRTLCGFRLPADTPTIANGKIRSILYKGSGGFGSGYTNCNVECGTQCP